MDTGFVEFRQLQEVGIFSYLGISCLKDMTMVLGVMRGLSMDSPRIDMGRLKTVPICLLGLKCSCEFA